MSLLPTKGPQNLVEALAVSPYYHLLPNREITPLLSFFSTNHPDSETLSGSDPSLRGVASRAMEAVNADPDAYKDVIDAMMEKFEKNSDVNLEKVRFKKPVIASEGLGTPELPKIPHLQDKMLRLISDVASECLVEHNAELGEPQLGQMKGVFSPEEYDELIAREIETQTSCQKRSINFTSMRPMKRVHLDQEQLADSTLRGIVDIIDKVGLDDDEEVPESLVYRGEGGRRILNFESLQLLHLFFTRLSESNSVSQLHVEYLRRTQQLCMNQIKGAHKLVKEAVVSCRLLLLIISTSGLEKQFYMETYISSVAELFSNAVTELGSTENDTDLTVCGGSKLIQELSRYVASGTTNERILTKLEYGCFDFIFGEVARSADLCSSLVQLLLSIYQSYDHQRSFLVHETLHNFSRIQRQEKPIKLKTSSGVTISAFTLLLIRSIQSVDTDYPAAEVEAFMRMPRSSNPTAPVNAKRQNLLDNLAGKFNESQQFSLTVARFCVEKLNSSEINYKAAFNILLEDLLKALSLPDTPGAETILTTLISQFINALSKGSIQNSNDPLALDIVGQVGIHILRLKKETGSDFTLNDPMEPTTIKQLADLTLQSMSLTLANGNYITLRTLTRFAAVLSKAASGISQHGYFHSSPDKKSRLTENEISLHLAVDRVLSSHPTKSGNDEPASYTNLNLAISLNALYDDFLTLLTQCLESSKVRLSTKAIKILSGLVELDLDVLKMAKIIASVSRLLESNAALSRDAIIELLGRYISSNIELLERYYKPICSRSTDDSVAVRKRVIRIMRDFIVMTPNIEIKAHCCVRLMKNLEDAEENLRELARETLYKTWFTSEMASKCKETVVMMTKVITHSTQSQKSFEQYIYSSSKGKRYSIEKKQLRSITEMALEIATDHIDTEDQRMAEQTLKLVAIFAGLEMDVLTQEHLISLQPYISMSDSSEDLCYRSLQIIRLSIPKYPALSQKLVAQLQDVILKKLTRYNNRELQEAVPILNYLSERFNSKGRLTNALISCVKLLGSKMSQIDDSSLHSQIVKLLQLLGCFGSFCDFETQREIVEKAQVGLKSDETVISLLMRFVIYFTKEELLVSLRTASIKSLLLICSFHPKMFLLKPVMKILNTEFKSGSHRMKLTILEGFNSFLLKEDDEAAKRNLELSSSSDKKIDVDVFHGTSPNYINDSVCLSLIQSFITPTLDLCVQEAGPLALTPVRFLELIMKLGFANPKVCAPTIIALEASPNKFVKKIAFSLHKQIFEKHESLADRNYAEAFRIAVEYNKRVGGAEFWKNVLFLRSVYKVVSRSYSSKKRLIQSLTRLFTVDSSSKDLKESIHTRDTIVFLVLNLSVLPFLSLEEVCLVLYHLDRSITHEGIEIADKVYSTVGSNSGADMSVENLQLLFVHAQSHLAMIYLRQTLSAAYGVPSSVMENYLPNRVDVELRQQPKAITLIDFPLENLELDVNLSHPSSFGLLFTRFVTSVKDFSL